MSVDTYIYIDKKFIVWLCTASCCCNHKKHCFECQKEHKIGKGKTLEEAVKIADKYDNDNALEVEYGFTLRPWCK